MKESVERLQKEGYSTILRDFFDKHEINPTWLSVEEDTLSSDEETLLLLSSSNTMDNKRQRCE